MLRVAEFSRLIVVLKSDMAGTRCSIHFFHFDTTLINLALCNFIKFIKSIANLFEKFPEKTKRIKCELFLRIPVPA